MWQLKNKLFQPLVLQRADGTSLHLPDRGTASLREEEMSPVIQRAATKGHITITQIPEPEPTVIEPSEGRKKKGARQ